MQKNDLHLLIVLVWMTLSSVQLFAQGGPGFAAAPPVSYEEPEDTYLCSTQFFDIAGEWVNDAATKRISKLVVKKTHVNNYRVASYLAMGNREQIFNYWDPLSISEFDLAYVLDVAQATCYIMPVIENGVKKLIVYSLIADPDGGWIDKKVDVLTRRNDIVDGAGSSSINEIVGYWKNELGGSDNEVYSRLAIKNTAGGFSFDLYKLIGDNKERLIENKRVQKTDSNGAHIVEWFSSDGDLKSTLICRAGKSGGVVNSLDVIIESSYSDGTPIAVFRQFFIKDPDALVKEKTKKTIESLEGTWYNLDGKGATAKLVIDDGDMEAFVYCEAGNCSVGKGTMELMEDSQLVGAVTKRVLSYRITELELDLDMNVGKDKPVVIAVDTTIEYFDEDKPVEFFTEIFIRKGTQVGPNLYAPSIGVR